MRMKWFKDYEVISTSTRLAPSRVSRPLSRCFWRESSLVPPAPLHCGEQKPSLHIAKCPQAHGEYSLRVIIIISQHLLENPRPKSKDLKFPGLEYAF